MLPCLSKLRVAAPWWGLPARQWEGPPLYASSLSVPERRHTPHLFPPTTWHRPRTRCISCPKYWEHRGRYEYIVERQVKVLIKPHLAIFFLLPSKKFLPISFKIQLLKTSPQTKAARCLFCSGVFSLPVHFELFAIFSYCLHFAKFVCLESTLQRRKQEWQKSPAGTRQKIRQKLGLIWRNRRKLAKLSKTTVLLLTVLPLNYFMIRNFYCYTGGFP